MLGLAFSPSEMSSANRHIIPFDPAQHTDAVVRLYRLVFGYETAHNEPHLAIRKKVAVADGLFFVSVTQDGAATGTIMAGYDGHRGWIYSLAVDPGWRHQGIGSLLVRHAEQALVAQGCLKINLQIVTSNAAVQRFYEKLGYRVEPRVSMGKIVGDNP